MGQHYVGIDTAFATKRDTPTHNLGVFVQANVTYLSISRNIGLETCVFGVTKYVMPKRLLVQLLHGQMKLDLNKLNIYCPCFTKGVWFQTSLRVKPTNHGLNQPPGLNNPLD